MPEHWPPPEEAERQRRWIEAWRPWARLIFWGIIALVMYAVFTKMAAGG